LSDYRIFRALSPQVSPAGLLFLGKEKVSKKNSWRIRESACPGLIAAVTKRVQVCSFFDFAFTAFVIPIVKGTCA